MSKKLFALLIGCFLMTSVASVFAQETITITTTTNLYINANLDNGIIQVLNPGDRITVWDNIPRNTVLSNQTNSSMWYLASLSDGTTGFVWFGELENRTDTKLTVSLLTPPSYPELVCSHCRYRELSVLEMTWRDGDYSQKDISNPQAALDLIYGLPARDVWIGYESGGYDMPDDAITLYSLEFTVSMNTLDWPLIYNDQLYDHLELPNDEVGIWFLYSPSTGEGFVFPFISLTPTATPSGEHLGSHLWGAYAVPMSAIENLNQIILAGI